MKKTAVFIILGFMCCMFSGCGGEEQTPKQRPPKIDPYADVEKCNLNTFTERCDVDDNGNVARFFCAYSHDAGFSYVQSDPCDDECVVHNGQAQCVSNQCDPNSSTTRKTCGTVQKAPHIIRQVVVEESCQEFNGSSFLVKANIDCDGICYNGECLNAGDDCKEKNMDRDSILGCNGHDVYVCDESGKIHKQFCPDEGYCQSFTNNGDKVFFCSSKCTTKRKDNLCSLNDNYVVQTQCSDIGNGALYQLHTDDLTVTQKDSKYCKDGVLRSLPHSVSCEAYCQDFCYGNIILPWLSISGTFEFSDCGVGRCEVKKHSVSRGYAECMQPCDEEGKEITVYGHAYFGLQASSSTLECKRFDDGLYYSTVYVKD